MINHFFDLYESQEIFTLSPENLENEYTLLHRSLDILATKIPESQWYTLVEIHFILCLYTCRDSEAELMLRRLKDKFSNSQRLETLALMYQAAKSKIDVVPESNLKAQKIVIAQHKSSSKYRDLLMSYLDTNPIDAEAWVELALSSSSDPQLSIQCLYQALIVEPESSYLYELLADIDTENSSSHLKRYNELNKLV